MARSIIKYCKKAICLNLVLLSAGFVYAQCGISAQKAVFDNIELNCFSDVSSNMRKFLLFRNLNPTAEICTQPIELQMHDSGIRICAQPKKQNTIAISPFVLKTPTIHSATRTRLQTIAQQQSDLESSFVDDGKKHRDGEKIKNASMLLLGGLLYFTLGELIGDNDDNGIYDLYEQDKSF